jgi:hypothetical protein
VLCERVRKRIKTGGLEISRGKKSAQVTESEGAEFFSAAELCCFASGKTGGGGMAGARRVLLETISESLRLAFARASPGYGRQAGGCANSEHETL